MGHRIGLISNVPPVVVPLVATLREMGHEPVAWLVQRKPGAAELPEPAWGDIGDRSAPEGVNLLFARSKEDVAPLFRGLDLDVVLCWGFGWKLPQEALDVPRLGSVNNHPALLPRHRGPYPLAWAFREGDEALGSTWHRMDAEFDTGPILAQSASRSRTRTAGSRSSARRSSGKHSGCCRACSSASRPATPAIHSRPRA